MYLTAALLSEFIRFVCAVCVRLHSAHLKDQRLRRVLRRTRKKREQKIFFALSPFSSVFLFFAVFFFFSLSLVLVRLCKTRRK
jgi:hypothetical protein